MKWAPWLGAALAVGCAASGGKGAPDATADVPFSDPRAALCGAADGGDGGPPSFALIQRLFTDNCVSCHTAGADLDLSVGHAWAGLVGHLAPTAESCGGTLVVPGDPDHSYLSAKLSSSTPCFGEQMPRTDFGSDPLPDCLVAAVRAWIAAGALD